MAMGFVSDDEFNRELEKLEGGTRNNIPTKNLPDKIINEKVIDINRGRGEGRKEVPSIVRNLAAEEFICGTPSKDIQEMLGISSSSVSAYKEGFTSTTALNLGTNPDKSLQKHIESVKNEIGGVARTKLMAALEAIDDEKLNSAKLKEIASVAKDLSFVSKNMEKDPSLTVNNVQQTLVYKPRMKEEEDYQVITVNE